MNIERAKTLKVGDLVNFPAVYDEPAGHGRVTHVGDTPRSHPCVDGDFLWVTVELPDGKSRHIWSSNRLS